MLALTMTEIPSGLLSDLGAGPDPRELIARIAGDRDKSALADLFRLFAPRIKAMMLRLSVTDAQAEDLVQETLLTVWRKAHLYSPDRGAVSTWLFAIARNLRIDMLRRQSNRPYVDFETLVLESPLPLGSAIAEERQIIERVSLAIETLSPEQREVVRLSFLNDLPHSAIAEKVGIPLGTVKSRLRLAYERLRPLLEDLQ
jgi:RNA polymerase sigma-70 factor, ECF subfamily